MNDGWSMGGRIYLCEGIGYGVDDNLNTFRIGTEQEILEGTDERIVGFLHRAGVNGISESEQGADRGYEGPRTALYQGKSSSKVLQRVPRRSMARSVRRDARQRP